MQTRGPQVEEEGEDRGERRGEGEGGDNCYKEKRKGVKAGEGGGRKTFLHNDG